jgi:hypothetical protein
MQSSFPYQACTLAAAILKVTTSSWSLWQTKLEQRRAKAKKEDPFEIWIQEYKELLASKKIKLPEYDDTFIVQS